MALLMCGVALPALAQSPNNGGLLVLVVDQSGAVVAGATVTVTNTATGATRASVSGPEGSAAISALPLDGSYRVAVSKVGFTADDVTGLVLRASEVATVRVKLVASGGQSEVTVYGTEQGVRGNAQVGRRFDSALIDETPILGRKVTSIPLFNSAFRQGKGTLYEGGVRVPLFMRWPGQIAPGQRCDVPVHFADLLPTLCDAAGVRVDPNHPVDGVSLRPVFAGGPLPERT